MDQKEFIKLLKKFNKETIIKVFLRQFYVRNYEYKKIIRDLHFEVYREMIEKFKAMPHHSDQFKSIAEWIEGSAKWDRALKEIDDYHKKYLKGGLSE